MRTSGQLSSAYEFLAKRMSERTHAAVGAGTAGDRRAMKGKQQPDGEHAVDRWLHEDLSEWQES